MRTISVSTEVFARIWALHNEGEEDENQILSRVLGVTSPHPLFPTIPNTGAESADMGHLDARNSVLFPEKFEIFRTYKGKKFRAQVSDGVWKRLDNNLTYESLNQLTHSVSGKNENAWVTWWCLIDGSAKKISTLREIGSAETSSHDDVKWIDDVFTALQSIGGAGHLEDIYAEVVRIRNERNSAIPTSYKSIVRREIEHHSSDSKAFLGRKDLFQSMAGIGQGRWSIRQK